MILYLKISVCDKANLGEFGGEFGDRHRLGKNSNLGTGSKAMPWRRKLGLLWTLEKRFLRGLMTRGFVVCVWVCGACGGCGVCGGVACRFVGTLWCLKRESDWSIINMSFCVHLVPGRLF